ncbi:MAG TPA: phosphopantetheine-binding protein, partial [Capillimicrobium sp.]|nr:phosphopantetheine-binding protein [Capillimicrobium sp.]
DDGVLEFLGRLDEQVKIRGFRVEPAEVEAVLAAHPGVREAAVVARADGAGGKRLVGYYAARAEASLEAEGVRAYLRARLPEYMVPAVLVRLSALPVGATGKLDRRALPEPEAALAGPARAYVPPASALEADVARIWEEVLGLERIGVERSFFDLGGHSLVAMRIMSRLQEALGVRMPLSAIFERPTIRELAAAVAAARVAGDAPREQAIRRVARVARRRGDPAEADGLPGAAPAPHPPAAGRPAGGAES